MKPGELVKDICYILFDGDDSTKAVSVEKFLRNKDGHFVFETMERFTGYAPSLGEVGNLEIFKVNRMIPATEYLASKELNEELKELLK